MTTHFVVPKGYSVMSTSTNGGVKVWAGFKGSCRPGLTRGEKIVEDAGSREYVISVLVDHANGWYKPHKAESDRARAERHQSAHKAHVKSNRDNPPLRWLKRSNVQILQVRVMGEWIDTPVVEGK